MDGAFVFRAYAGALFWLGQLAAVELLFCMLGLDIVRILTTALFTTSSNNHSKFQLGHNLAVVRLYLKISK
jgi:hypothetical protein